MKKSTSPETDYIAEAMGYNPEALPSVIDAPPPEIVVAPATVLSNIPHRKDAYKDVKTTNKWFNYGISQKPVFDWVLPTVRAGEVCILYSPGGTGKSFWALQAAVTIASGVDCLGWGVMGHQYKTGRTAYISLEDGEADVGSRLSSLFDVYPQLYTDKAKALFEVNFDMKPMSGNDLDLMDLNHQRKGFKWKDVTEGVRLLVIDTLSQAHTGDENTAKDCSLILKNLLEMARRTNVATLVLHHTSKQSARDGDTSQQASRGSSVLTDNIRNAHFMAGMADSEVPQWVDEKGNQIADRFGFAKWGTSKHNGSTGCDDVWYQRSTGGVLVPTILSRKEVTKEAKRKKKELDTEMKSKVKGDLL